MCAVLLIQYAAMWNSLCGHTLGNIHKYIKIDHNNQRSPSRSFTRRFYEYRNVSYAT